MLKEPEIVNDFIETILQKTTNKQKTELMHMWTQRDSDKKKKHNQYLQKFKTKK